MNYTPHMPLGSASKRPLILYFILTFVISWGIALPGLLPADLAAAPAAINPRIWFVIASYVPSAAGLSMTFVLEGQTGLKRLVARLIPWRAGLHWYLIVLGGYPAIGFLACRIAAWFGAPSRSISDWPHFYAGVLPALLIDPGPLGEEFGWRGFALPRMLDRRSPGASALLLGVLWAVWHLPPFLVPIAPQRPYSFLVFAAGTIALSCFHTWMYLRTGNLFLMLLLHLMSNYAFTQIEVAYEYFMPLELLCAAIIFLAGGLKFDRGKEKQTTQRVRAVV